MPSNRRVQSLPGRNGSLARGSYTFCTRPLRRSRCEHGGVGFDPVGRSGLVLVLGSGDRAYKACQTRLAVSLHARQITNHPAAIGLDGFRAPVAVYIFDLRLHVSHVFSMHVYYCQRQRHWHYVALAAKPNSASVPRFQVPFGVVSVCLWLGLGAGVYKNRRTQLDFNTPDVTKKRQ